MWNGPLNWADCQSASLGLVFYLLYLKGNRYYYMCLQYSLLTLKGCKKWEQSVRICYWSNQDWCLTNQSLDSTKLRPWLANLIYAAPTSHQILYWPFLRIHLGAIHLVWVPPLICHFFPGPKPCPCIHWFFNYTWQLSKFGSLEPPYPSGKWWLWSVKQCTHLLPLRRFHTDCIIWLLTHNLGYLGRDLLITFFSFLNTIIVG